MQPSILPRARPMSAMKELDPERPEAIVDSVLRQPGAVQSRRTSRRTLTEVEVRLESTVSSGHTEGRNLSGRRRRLRHAPEGKNVAQTYF